MWNNWFLVNFHLAFDLSSVALAFKNSLLWISVLNSIMRNKSLAIQRIGSTMLLFYTKKWIHLVYWLNITFYSTKNYSNSVVLPTALKALLNFSPNYRYAQFCIINDIEKISFTIEPLLLLFKYFDLYPIKKIESFRNTIYICGGLISKFQSY